MLRAATPGNAVSHHSVKPDGSEQQGQDSEQAAQAREQAVLVEVHIDLLLHGLNADDGEVRIDLPEDLSDARLRRRACCVVVVRVREVAALTRERLTRDD